ncbi:DUF5672 family protein [Butyrivibrio sp. NC3005]|uniref:DUF5672 family protein n=1 Tax=Butyrivibrio sp. NC3005 TaxID=1280685 RepID=UPI000417254B|nr:DUF5672 family protein [Butyrivibrio sp. NC3005]
MAEFKNGKLQLPDVTLVAVTSVKIKATIKAMKYSMERVDFKDAVLVTHRKPLGLPSNIRFGKIEKLDNIDKFNYDMVYELYKYVNTSHIMLVHYDGFVVNPESWRDEFLDYDYIGAPWPIPPSDDKITFRDPDGKLIRVGNSVGIRSKKLLEAPSKLNIPWQSFYGWYNEDGFLCCHHHKELEEYGLKFAPIEVARYLSQEQQMPETLGIVPFAFHKWEGPNAKYPKFDNPTVFERVYKKMRHIMHVLLRRENK